MDYVERMMGNRWSGINAQSFLKWTALSPAVQRHLQKVYATLAVALAISALGCYADMTLHVAGVLTYLTGFGCLVALGMTASTPSTLNKRYGLLAGFSFAQGASLGPLVSAAVSLNPSVLLSALAATGGVFACFSGAALLTKRREWLYLGGILSSAVSGMMLMRVVGWMTGANAAVFQAELLLGLVVFAGYIVFDTQMIVEKAYAGNTDHVKHALDLMVDVLAIFVRVLIILMRNAEKQKENEQRKKRR